MTEFQIIHTEFDPITNRMRATITIPVDYIEFEFTVENSSKEEEPTEKIDWTKEGF